MITVIPRGVDVEQLNLLADLGPSRNELLDGPGLPPDARIILNVGRHEPQKGQIYLIEAMSEIWSERPDAALLVVGRQGNSTNRLHEAVRGLDLGDSVRFLGPRQDVAGLMRAADVFVFPSLFEGLGVALLEAMALGVPVVASDIAPMNHICEHGHAGFLCEPANPQDLARAMLQVLDDPDGVADRSQRARQQIRTGYDIHQTSSEREQTYLELLKL